MYGTAGTKEGVDMVKAQGADHVFNHRLEGYQGEIMVSVRECLCERERVCVCVFV